MPAAKVKKTKGNNNMVALNPLEDEHDEKKVVEKPITKERKKADSKKSNKKLVNGGEVENVMDEVTTKPGGKTPIVEENGGKKRGRKTTKENDVASTESEIIPPKARGGRKKKEATPTIETPNDKALDNTPEESVKVTKTASKKLTTTKVTENIELKIEENGPAKKRGRKATKESDVASVEDEVIPLKAKAARKKREATPTIEIPKQKALDKTPKETTKAIKTVRNKKIKTATTIHVVAPEELVTEESPSNLKKKQTKKRATPKTKVETDEAHDVKKMKLNVVGEEGGEELIIPDVTPEKVKPVKKERKMRVTVKKNIKDDEEDEMDDDDFEPTKPIKRATKRNKTPQVEQEIITNNAEIIKSDDDVDGGKPAKILKNITYTVYKKEDFELTSLIEENGNNKGSRYNFKISSWNVAGLRSWLKKDGFQFLDYEEPDIFCIQETKCANDQLPEEAVRLPGYHPYWLCKPGGYAGVAIYSKLMPIHVLYGIGDSNFDGVGRLITAEYEKFYLLNVYVPNSGRKLVNLELRMHWEELFKSFVQRLDKLKPVIIVGDMNVSHQEIDLANPKTNTRSAGFTIEEREKMTELLAAGYIDTFRALYPKRTGAYTYWTYMANARKRNVGWRLDYFIVSERFMKRVVDNVIRAQCMGSDHCPITLFLKL